MKKLITNQITNLLRSLFVACLLQINANALKLRASTPAADLAQASSTELLPVEANVTNNASQAVALNVVQQIATVSADAGSQRLAGRRTLKYLVALQEWQRLSRVGMRCPKPQPCECHCDCPATAIAEPPPLVPACPVYANAWPTTPAPTTKAPAVVAITTTPSPKHKPAQCAAGEVKLSDGTCTIITYETVLKLEKMVEEMRIKLLIKQVEFNKLAEVNCTSCPGAALYFKVRPELLRAHDDYYKALRLFLGVLNEFESMEKDKKEADDGGDDKDLGPEFVPGVKSFRSHCEPWTALNVSLGKPTDNFCAVVCRQQPSCVGFNFDPKSYWCVWFDDAKPEPKEDCTSQTKTKFLKRWQAKLSPNLWVTIDKVHLFDKAIINAIAVANLNANVSTNFYDLWRDENANGDQALAMEHQSNLSTEVGHYGNTMFDAGQMREQLEMLRSSAYQLTLEEVDKRPAIPAPPSITTTKKIVIPEGLEEPLSDPPKILEWHDFPNSQDTKWSQQHPDCPMGTPCFCDCKCRGAPPQNFVEPPPPPYPPPPCPPPPLMPPAFMLSDIAVAQSIR